MFYSFSNEKTAVRLLENTARGCHGVVRHPVEGILSKSSPFISSALNKKTDCNVYALVLEFFKLRLVIVHLEIAYGMICTYEQYRIIVEAQ